MQALAEMGKEDRFQPFEKEDAMQVIRHRPWYPPFFFAFWGLAKVRKNRKAKVGITSLLCILKLIWWG